MTIQRRILAGHLAVAGLLLVPAVFALARLDSVARRTHQSLQSGLDRLNTLDQLRSQLADVAKLQKMSVALGDPLVAPDGPDLGVKVEAAAAALRGTYERARPHLIYLGRDSGLRRLDALLGPGTKGGRREETSSGPGSAAGEAGESARAKGGGAAGGASAGPSGGPTGAAPSSLSWLDEQLEDARIEIAAAYDAASRKMMAETLRTERDAQRAFEMSLLGFIIAIPLAAGSAYLVVRGIRGPLLRLMSATSAVRAGRFGIEVPVQGRDEIASLTDAFNKMNRSLAHLEKMKADFLSVVSHELKTPLTCIKGFARELRSALPPPAQSDPEVTRWLNRITGETDLLAHKVSELHVFGRIEAEQLKLEPREIMSEGFLLMIGESFKPIAAERQIGFKIDLEGVPPRFTADRERLKQVLLNLLDNAFKYTPRGGEVHLRGRDGGGVIEIEVADSGPGIPPDQLEIIFEKYARVRSGSGRSEQGTGLGLAVARGIVLAHGGTIGVTSQPGQGCRFVVRLPLSRPEPGPERASVGEVA